MAKKKQNSSDACWKSNTADDAKNRLEKMKRIESGEVNTCNPDNGKFFEEKNNPLSSKGN